MAITAKDYKAGCLVGMLGKDCVAIASDHRSITQSRTLSMEFKKVFQMGPRTLIGLTGLEADILTVYNRVRFRQNVIELKESCEMTPKSIMELLSTLLYEHRVGPYFLESIVAGFDTETLEPYLCILDLVGAPNEPKDFVVAGSCAKQLYGMCESLWHPDMDSNQLLEALSQATLTALDRDAIGGLGVTVFIIEKDKITEHLLRTRMD